MPAEDIQPAMVDMEDWMQSGQGWNAITYHHKQDENLLLKLNDESLPFEHILTEYTLTKAVYDLGVRCPATMSLVTDGKRYGFITERFLGKRSFARIISENPDMLEPLAKSMAESAHMFHSLQCDTAQFESVTERLRNEANSCKWVKGKLKAILNACADGMRPVTTCLHGDMHPGNILRTADGDFWIDLGRFGYGDPDLDYATQFVLANLAPKAMSKSILHLDHKTYCHFVESYGRYYYGDDFSTPETQERLKRAICLTLSHALTKSPAAVTIFGSYIKGHERVTLFLIKLISLFIRAPHI